MTRYFVEIAYDGSEFHGWQYQPNGYSVQQAIQECLSKIMRNQKIGVVGCGRTDAGVHAQQFYFHFDLEETHSSQELVYKLNRMLPRSVAVYDCLEVEPDAHARFDAVSRTYSYFIETVKSPFYDRFAFLYQLDLDIELMNKACSFLFDYTDFTSFSKLHTDTFTNDCEIMYAKWSKDSESGRIVFSIKANRFLRNMVRAIVGTMLEIGSGKLPAEAIKETIESKDRGAAGRSVEACGLHLVGVEYPYSVNSNQHGRR